MDDIEQGYQATEGALSNADRAENGLKCLEQVFDYEENDLQTALTDCLVNLMHLCADDTGVIISEPDDLVLNFDRALETARMHFEAEIEEEEPELTEE